MSFRSETEARPMDERRCPVCAELHPDDMVSHVLTRHRADAPRLLALAIRSEPGAEGLREALEQIADLYHNDNVRPGTFAVRAGEIAVKALAATPAADSPPDDGGVMTWCPLPGVHEHAFRGPHKFKEWDPTPISVEERWSTPAADSRGLDVDDLERAMRAHILGKNGWPHYRAGSMPGDGPEPIDGCSDLCGTDIAREYAALTDSEPGS